MANASSGRRCPTMAFRLLIDDGMQISLGTGIGKYSKSLYEALSRRSDVIVDLLDWTPESFDRKANRAKYLKYINSNEFQKTASSYDAVLFTNYAVPFRRMPCKTICCIADMVAFLHPETLPVAYRYYNRAMIRNSVHKADLVLTISDSVKREIVEHFPRCAPKVAYTWLGLYEGIHKDDDPAPYEDSNLASLKAQNFFLFVSTVEKRKNVGLVLDAFLELRKSGAAEGYKMVFAGRLGYGSEEFTSQASSSEFANDVIFTGYVSDADLNRLYNEASALIFPSVYEGFGFAQIECMSVCLPIILSDIPTNREISRDYGIFFDLDDPDSLVGAMRSVVDGGIDRTRLCEIAERYLPDFNWDSIAQQYVRLVSGQLDG